MHRQNTFNIVLICFLLIIFLPELGAQTDSLSPSLERYNDQRLNLTKNGMMILGGWAVANIGTGSAGYFAATGPSRYFHQMNAFWNVVNLGLAVGGYMGAVNSSAAISLAETVSEQQALREILLFNAGLDVAYLGVGLWMHEKAQQSARPDLWKGYSRSLWLQGGFLLTFDIALYLMHRNLAHKGLMPLMEKIQVGPGGIGFRF